MALSPMRAVIGATGAGVGGATRLAIAAAGAQTGLHPPDQSMTPALSIPASRFRPARDAAHRFGQLVAMFQAVLAAVPADQSVTAVGASISLAPLSPRPHEAL